MAQPPWMNYAHRHKRAPDPDNSDDGGTDSSDGEEFVQIEEDIDPRKFFIVSNLGGRVLDVRGGNPKPNVEVNMYDRHPDDKINQLWYQDDDGVIRSCLNRYTMDTSSGRLRMQPPNPNNPDRCWVLDGEKIVKRDDPSTCLEVPKAKDQNNRRIEPATYGGGDHQHWYIDYINE